jgi:hypothetical protein
MLDKQNDYEFFIQGRKPSLITIKEDFVRKFINVGNILIVRVKHWNDHTIGYIKEFFEMCDQFSKLQLPSVLLFQTTCSALKDFVLVTPLQEQLEIIPDDPRNHKFEIVQVISQIVMIAKIVLMSIMPQEITMIETFDPNFTEDQSQMLNDQIMNEVHEFIQENKSAPVHMQSLLDPTMQNIDKDTGKLTPWYHSQQINEDQLLNLIIQTTANINTYSDRRLEYTIWRIMQWFMNNGLTNTTPTARYFRDHLDEFLTLSKEEQVKMLNNVYDIIRLHIKNRDVAHEKLDF